MSDRKESERGARFVLSYVDPARRRLIERYIAELEAERDALKETNSHYRDMLKCPDCGKPVWECSEGGAVVGHMEATKDE